MSYRDGDIVVSPILAAIESRRLELNLTQRDLADECGTKQSHISAVLGGRTAPTLPVLERMCLAVGLRLTTSYVGGIPARPKRRPGHGARGSNASAGRELAGDGMAPAAEGQPRPPVAV